MSAHQAIQTVQAFREGPGPRPATQSPGPWLVRRMRVHWGVFSAAGDWIVDVRHRSLSPETGEADAYLIAGAPALRDALAVAAEAIKALDADYADRPSYIAACAALAQACPPRRTTA